MAKGKNERKKPRFLQPKAKVMPEDFKLDFPAPRMRPSPAPPSFPSAPIDAKPAAGVEVARASMHARRQIPNMATALLASTTISAALFIFFFWVLQTDLFFSAALAVPLFTGFSILIFNYLEERQ